jgi:hypothetical protein
MFVIRALAARILPSLGVTQPTIMLRKLAATQENNAWRSRKRVMADYVPECMHHHTNVLRQLAAEGKA